MRTFAFLIRDNIVAKYALAPQLSCADLRRMSKDMLAALEPGSNDCFVIKLATFPKKSNRPSSFVSYTANQILPCFFINNGSSSSPVRCTDRSLLPPLLLLLSSSFDSVRSSGILSVLAVIFGRCSSADAMYFSYHSCVEERTMRRIIPAATQTGLWKIVLHRITTLHAPGPSSLTFQRATAVKEEPYGTCGMTVESSIQNPSGNFPVSRCVL
mmetsp:Transcript_39107/g.63636  ORF Transcript_39107/g.63636 Transcript_39107/m.63636 type:complete len:213 (-) Transcript_39107:237-875(-)